MGWAEEEMKQYPAIYEVRCVICKEPNKIIVEAENGLFGPDVQAATVLEGCAHFWERDRTPND
jgi:hypothetical protein